MHITRGIQDTRDALNELRANGGRVALVPTMGNLHAGHLSLVEKARTLAEHVVVSIFVNPLQFGPNEDYASYPRTFAADQARLEQTGGVTLIFAPPPEAMYPAGLSATTTVTVPELSDILCGAARPGHFTGVATVVARLFNVVQPEVAVFGEKDYQQLLVIRRMVRDLLMPVEIVGMPTYREADGLAMSSRNQYLTPEQRALAPRLYALLQHLAQRIAAGERDPGALEQQGLARLAADGFVPDYLAIRNAEDLTPADPARPEWVILVAARLGKARLIDNLRCPLP